VSRPRRPAGPWLGWVFAAVGVALLAGAAYAYHAVVTRPLAWPKVAADVVSSRVVTPRKPDQLQAEIVLDVRDGPSPRRVTIVPSWSSSSHAAVKAYVDGYPAGASIDVAVNPADRDDVRFELGATLTNLILPGVLGVLGAVFAVIAGVVALRPAAASVAPAAVPSAQARRWAGRVFAAIGVGACGLAVWIWSLGTPLDWPEVEASVVEGRVIQVRSTRSQGPPRPRYDIQVTFAYAVGGTRYTSTTASGDTSSEGNAATRLGGAGQVQLRIEIFNLFNRVNFGPPSLVAFSGTGTETAPLPSFGQIRTTTTSARQMQIGVRLAF
jgi:hypothetical protein